MSNDQLSLCLQLFGLGVSFLLGFFLGIRGSWTIAAVLGLGVDVVAQFALCGGGGGAFVGLIVFPVGYVIAVAMGSLVRQALRWIWPGG